MITNQKRLQKILTSPIKKRTDWKAIELYSYFTKFCKEHKTKSFEMNIKPVKDSFQISNVTLRNKLKKLEQHGLIQVNSVGCGLGVNNWHYDIEMSYKYNKLGAKRNDHRKTNTKTT